MWLTLILLLRGAAAVMQVDISMDAGRTSEEWLWGQAGPAACQEIHQLIVYFCKEPRVVQMGAMHTACLSSWEVHPLLAQDPRAAPALVGEGSVSGCSSIVGLRPQNLSAWEEAYLRSMFPYMGWVCAKTQSDNGWLQTTPTGR